MACHRIHQAHSSPYSYEASPVQFVLHRLGESLYVSFQAIKLDQRPILCLAAAVQSHFQTYLRLPSIGSGDLFVEFEEMKAGAFVKCSRKDHERAGERVATSEMASEKAGAEREASTDQGVRSGYGEIHQQEAIEEACNEAEQS